MEDDQTPETDGEEPNVFQVSLHTYYYNHYVDRFGAPGGSIGALKLQKSPLKLKPRHVFVMAMRLGINLT